MIPLPSKALPDSGGMPVSPPDLPPGQDRTDDDEDAADGRQRPTPTERPTMHRHSASASGPPAP